MKLILIIKYIILGIIQGFTEPIPISSSGHLLILKKIFNINTNDINFEIIVNFGSFIAIAFLYRKEILNIIHDFIMYLKDKNKEYKSGFNYGLKIILASIPAGIIGLIFKDKIDIISNDIKLIGIALLITSVFLFIIKDFKGVKDKDNISFLDSLKIGIFQSLALLPGISRSGSTIVGAMLCDVKREESVNFSFMLYIPISIASFMLGVSDIITTPNINSYIYYYIIGMIFSILITYLSAKWFINIIKKGKLIYFSVYCLIVGVFKSLNYLVTTRIIPIINVTTRSPILIAIFLITLLFSSSVKLSIISSIF